MNPSDTAPRPAPAAGGATPGEAPLLSIENLSVGFRTDTGPVTVLEGVSYEVPAGTTVGLVGESGCGKSVSVMTLMRLLPSPPSFVSGGKILFEGEDLLALPDAKLKTIRGNRVSMIFQEPMTSLNPTFTIGYQLAEVLRLHRGLTGREARARSLEMLELTGIGAAEKRLGQYPHELSGGLRQRVMIAMALLCRPQLLIADEPTTALDVTIQAQILELLRRLQAELGMAVLLITHDLGVVAETCRFVNIMYAGRIVEHGPAEAVFADPRHPYTRGLLASIPRLDEKRQWLPTIKGMVPSPGARGQGCHFAERCGEAHPLCRTGVPPLEEVAGGHFAACFHCGRELAA